jgi:pyruvate formate lyase activating enzyme
MKDAKYYLRGNDNLIKCQLCPYGCTIPENSKGKCNVRLNINGFLYSENYGKVSGVHLDPIEKKPLYHFHPGQNVLSIGTFGCNLTCTFCQNHHLSHPHNIESLFSVNYSPEEILEISLKQENNIGIAFTYNEPIVWYEYMYDIAILAKQNSLKGIVVSNGYINRKPLSKLIDIVDAFNIDLKAYNNGFYKNICGGSLKPVKQTLKTIFSRNKHIEITNLVIPGLNDSEKEFREMVIWLAGEFGANLPLHINRYFPSYQLTIEPTSQKTLLSFKEIAQDLLNFVYIGNMVSNGNSNTICPKCQRTAIVRKGFRVNTNEIDEEGNCKNCGYKIAIC